MALIPYISLKGIVEISRLSVLNASAQPYLSRARVKYLHGGSSQSVSQCLAVPLALVFTMARLPHSVYQVFGQ